MDRRISKFTLRRITCLTDCALALFCMLLWVPIASGQQTSASEPQPEPTITAKMIDPVDSSRDPAGKQYRAGLIRPVNIGNGVIIAQGSAATVVLVKNGSGWSVQLSSLVIKGQVTTVTSNPGTVIGAAAQASAANAANAANAVLGRFGRKPNTYSPAAVVAMGERVILTPGISLSFVLNAIPVVPEPSAAPAPVPVAKPSAAGQNVPAQARNQPGTIYLCSIKTNNEPSVLYRSGVFHVAANTSLSAINDAFENYLRKNYHLQFSGGACMDMFYDPDGQRYIQAEQGAKNKRKIVIVDWQYVPGQDTPPPPSPTPGTAVASGKGSPTYCSGAIRGGDMYFSDIFEVPLENDREDVRQDYRFGFARFVVKKYGLDPGRNGEGSWDGGVNCMCQKKTFTECRSDKDQNEQYYREKSHGGFKIIETGWNGSGRLGP